MTIYSPLTKMVRCLDNHRVCVTVKKVKKGQYVLLEGEEKCGILPAGTQITELEGAIVDSNGIEIKPEGRFFITTETIDPFHLVVDIF